jgi:antirestriction protein
MTITLTQNAPAVYIASLSDYNAGILHGCWLELDGVTDHEQAIQAMLAQSPYARKTGDIAEEWAIHDSERCGGQLGEFATLADLGQIAEDFEEIEARKLEWELYLKWNSCTYHHMRWGCVEEFAEAYRGTYDYAWEFAYEFIHESVDVDSLPDLIRHNIDYKGAWEELETGDFYEIRYGDQSHIFC